MVKRKLFDKLAKQENNEIISSLTLNSTSINYEKMKVGPKGPIRNNFTRIITK
jgi:hypothetical protein